MSDRIDRLVNRANNMRLEGWENAQAVHDLATIAREAEANAKGQEANAVFALRLKRDAEARAAEWIDRCYQSEERALKAEAMCEWLVEVLDEDGFGPYPNYKFIGIPTPDPLPESRKQAWLKAAREAVIHGE